MSPAALFVTTVPITLEAFLLPFAKHFRSHGWRVDALSNGASRDSRLADAFDNRFDVAWSRSPFDPRNLIGSAGRVRDVVKAGGYDLVHVHTPIAAFVTRYALRSARKRPGPIVIYTAHGFHFYEGGDGLRNLAFRRMERTAARWTDFLVTINREDFEAAKAFGTVPPDRVRLIPGIGVDTSLFRPDAASPAERASLRQELHIPDSAFAVTMVAEFAPVKRHDHVVRALQKVSDPGVVLVLVGEGPLLQQVQLAVEQRGLAKRVRFAGYRRDVPAVLASSDAVLLASEREGLARSVLEGMASGLPVIGTMTRGIADAAGPEAGWLVPKDDVDALAHAIDEAASNRTEAARRGTLARRRAEQEFALPHIIQAYEELYSEALASRI